MNIEKHDFLIINLCYMYLDFESLSNLSLTSKSINNYINSVFFIKKIHDTNFKEIDNINSTTNSDSSGNTSNIENRRNKEKYKKIGDNISIKSKDTSLSSNTTNTSSNKINLTVQNQNTGKNEETNNQSYFGYVGSMFSTINKYTIGTLGTLTNIGYNTEVHKKTDSEIFFENKELVKLFKLKLSYWEDILEEMLNQKTLLNTIDINNKYIGNLKNERLRSMRMKNNLKLEEYKENLDSNNKMTPQLIEMYNVKLKYKLEEMTVKKDGLLTEIKKVEEEINSILETDKRESLSMFKLQRYLESFFEDEKIYKNFTLNNDIVFKTNKNTEEIIKKDSYRLMIEQFNPLSLYYKERNVSKRKVNY